MRRPAGSLIAAALSALTVAGAEAQSCFSMQAEMMHLQSRGVLSGADRDRYARAYREQANVLSQTEIRARNAGCFGGGFFLFRRAVDPSCRTLVPKLRDMQDNLARLDHMRRRGDANVAGRIEELQGMMSARGCDLPGGDSDNRDAGNFIYEPETPYYSGNGTYRTLCVRTCDGYYFPISFSTTSDHFAEDAQSCDALCPGAEARLFYHPNPGGGPENMIAVTGEPYSSLANAFKYRTSIDSACTCRPAGGYAAAGYAAGGYSVAAAQSLPPVTYQDDPTAPRPRPRPAPGEDPETLADRAGDYVPRAAADMAAAAGAQTVIGADGRPIRIVGPAYWGNNKQQDDLVIAPVPN